MKPIIRPTYALVYYARVPADDRDSVAKLRGMLTGKAQPEGKGPPGLCIGAGSDVMPMLYSRPPETRPPENTSRAKL